MSKKLTQRDKIILHLLKGEGIDRKYTIDNGICWELSARVLEVEAEYGIEILRQRVKLGRLSMMRYWLNPDDIDKVRSIREVMGREVVA